MNTYKLTLISLLAAVCVIGRITFQFIPNIQPVTAIIIITGAMLGVLPAICIAVITTYITNLFLGMGIWTIWQMTGWAVIGLTAGIIGKYTRQKQMLLLTIFSFFAAFIYGLIVNLGTFTFSGNFVVYYLAGITFDIAHAIGNVVFMILLYPVLVRVFRHTQRLF
ncbi:energy-coupling factor transport system substrate-specific component [Gracilibacillus orientalis]|uniref:Energy-coupling factor transport system substrate-specific component n=1 Tax=Gracilibacillus orientalis TaxID=334253 RepID=A0A1I4L037_9BACI|nr:ECF transporter S component [Gracilibacillus orientalis]SFL84301.1 energy-coupling factor transport system substrate-specific component [Gracilibacillus orientalis]